MKQNLFLAIAVSLVLMACSTADDIGMSIRPSQDDVAVVTDSFYIAASSVAVENVFSETDKPYLGIFYDEVYGSFDMDFITDFHYYKDFTFPAKSASDSLYVVIYYKSFFGDSTAVMEATAYRVDLQNLDYSQNYTTDIDISQYCSMSEVLGKASYVPYDASVSDSIRSLSGYCNTVKIPITSSEIRETILSDTSLMTSQTNFSQFFKGVYVKNTYGTGMVLDIDSVNLELYYRYPPDTTKVDSLVYSTLILPANKTNSTVVHINARVDPVLNNLADTMLCVSSPGGEMVKFKLPWTRMYERICSAGAATNININYASLALKALDVMTDGSAYSGILDPPDYVMMIKESDIETFFAQSSYPLTGVSTYLGMYNESDSTYTFANMADFIQTTLDAGPDSFESVGNLVLLPVTGTTNVAGTDATIFHEFYPTGMMIGSGTNKAYPFRLVVTYSDL